MTAPRKILAPFLIILEIISLIIFLCIGLFFLVKHSGKASPEKVNSETATNLLPTVSPVNAGQIVLIEDNQITVLDTSTMQKIPLSIPNIKNPTSLTFSADGSMLFTDSDRNTLIIYHMTDGNITVIPKMDPNPRVDSASHISPNNKYFIITKSCCPGDVGRTIVKMDGKIIKQLTGGDVAWSPDGSTLAISKGEYTLGIPTGPPPTNSSIYLELVLSDSVREKLLIKGSNQFSFRPIKWTDDNTLLVKKIIYDKPIPSDFNMNDTEENDNRMKIYQNPKISYLTLNTSTLKISPAPYEEKTVDYANYSSDHIWKVFTEGNSMFGPTFVSRIDGSQKIKISDRAYAVWRPQSQ